MIMEISRNVILDLLPLYLADEASADTRALVENYLESDPALAKLAERSAMTDLMKDIPIPLTKENQMEAYEEAKRMILQRTLIVGALIAFVILSMLSMAALAFFFLVNQV